MSGAKTLPGVKVLTALGLHHGGTAKFQFPGMLRLSVVRVVLILGVGRSSRDEDLKFAGV